MNRRRLLDTMGAVGMSAVFGGCLGGSDSEPARTIDGTTAPPPSCDDDLTRLSDSYVVADGPLDGFELSVDTDSVSLGNQFTAHLRNVTDEERLSGNKLKYDIQRRTEEDWRTIFQRYSSSYFTDEAIAHEPGGGVTWNLTASRSGLALEDDPFHYVCKPLASGDYRFVYWGLTPEREKENDYETDYALGARFVIE